MNKVLTDLLDGLDIIGSTPYKDLVIEGVENSSQRVHSGYIFVCIKGYSTNGHQYVEEAIKRGACLIIAEEIIEASVPVLYVPCTKTALEHLANRFYDCPQKKLKLHAITGTNGKTTSAYFAFHLMKSIGIRVGFIGTIGIMYSNTVSSTLNTTPDALVLNRTLHEMIQAGVTDCVMEVSSQAISEKRISSLRFDSISFTNLTHDHLDYHKSMENYGETKASLFRQFKTNAIGAVLNGTDSFHQKIMALIPKHINILKYSTDYTQADLYGEIDQDTVRVRFNNKVYDANVSFSGNYNLENLLCAIGILQLSGYHLNDLLLSLPQLVLPPGRMEIVKKSPSPIFVDYGHTPEALRLVMQDLSKQYSSILVLLSAAGERDKTKRAQMAEIVAEYAQFLIVTVHDPRYESPENIIQDLLEGMNSSKDKSICFTDRRDAIRYLTTRCEEFECSIIFGKGHDRFEKINGTLHPFDEPAIISEYLHK
jgi:UDP-N-acetylmuramoyl-L-alanyl-D-glutamate--2,6-diaminopimelate ligase